MKGNDLNIDALYAYITRDKDGTEGVVGMMTFLGWAPLVGADMERMDSLADAAQEIANATKLPIMLAKFSKREDLRVVTPNRLSSTTAERIGESSEMIIKKEGPK